MLAKTNLHLPMKRSYGGPCQIFLPRVTGMTPIVGD